MNSITHTISGLASSLCLHVGLTQVAQKLDPISAKEISIEKNILSAEICVIPCSFSQEKGL